MRCHGPPCIRRAGAPAAASTGFTHLGPVSWRCVTPTACPRESGGRPGSQSGAGPGVSSPSPRTARSGDPGPIPDSRGSPGSGSGAGPGRFALSPPAGGAERRHVRFAAFRAAAAAQNAAIVRFAAFRAAVGKSGMGPRFREGRRRGQRPAQPGCRAHPMHALARCVHAVGRRLPEASWNVMRCHDLHADGAYPVVPSGMWQSFRAVPPVSRNSRLRHGALPFDPSSFRSSRRRPGRAAGP